MIQAIIKRLKSIYVGGVSHVSRIIIRYVMNVVPPECMPGPVKMNRVSIAWSPACWSVAYNGAPYFVVLNEMVCPVYVQP